MSSLQYINSKLSDAIYILTVHEGDARTRLARVITKIQFLPPSSVPSSLQQDFEWIQKTIKRGIGNHPPDSPPPYKLTGIKNSTARKIIEKIVFIQDKVNRIIMEEMDL